MHSRRAIIGLGATAAVGLTAGCLGFISGDEPLEFESERAAPTDEAIDEHDFEESEIREESIEEVVDVGVEREFHATFWVSAYTHTAEIAGVETDAAGFVAVSIPGMKVLGSQQNPIADMDNEELIEEFRGEFQTDQGEIREVTHRSTDELEILDEDREVDTFDAVAERDGESYDVVLEMASFEHEDDILVLVGLYPAEVEDDDPPIDDLLAAVEHPVE